MTAAHRILAACPLLAFLLAAAPPAQLSYPVTKTVGVRDTYFGKTVVADPYRWLEDGKDPEVVAWSAAQTKLAIDYLVATPQFGTIQARVAELARTSASRFGLQVRGDRYFYERATPPQAQAQLIVRDAIGGEERVLFDPAVHAENGVQPAIASYYPSPDGKTVAISTDLAGTEDDSLTMLDVATGKSVGETLAHVGGGLSPVAFLWDADGRGFLHTLWPKNPDGTYATSGILIYHHTLGTDPATDTYVFGKDRSPKSEYALASSADGTTQELTASAGDGVAAAIFMRAGDEPFTEVATTEALIGTSADPGGAFVGKAFYAIAHGRHPRGEVVALEAHGSFDTAKVIVPVSEVVPSAIVPHGDTFVVSDIDGGDASARLFTRDGALLQQLPIPPISTIDELAADPGGSGRIIVGYENYETRRRWLAYDARSNTLNDLAIADAGPGDFSNVVSERVFVPSLDGSARIPLEITHERGIALDGTAPTIMSAYGMYGTISRPYFSATSLAWLERGGLYAQAMVRGGGEYGEAWHRAARLATKTLSSDDLAACAQWLGAHGYGTAKHLGITGASAGGFLMGLAISRNPNLYRAVFARVGIYDLLRWELTPNGAYNTGEFGTVTDPLQFAFMLAQSPYHNLHRGVAYPAVLMTTGENDPRVDPYMSRKMIATLQTATSSRNPILLIQKAGQGHGLDLAFDDRVERATLEYAFFESQLR